MKSPFIRKLSLILSEKQYDPIISWDNCKQSIIIHDVSLLEDVVLRRFFRKIKYQSFVRQLNIYGFRKRKDQDSLSFTHNALENGEGIESITAKKKSLPENVDEKESEENEAEKLKLSTINMEDKKKQKVSQEQNNRCLQQNAAENSLTQKNTFCHLPFSYSNFLTPPIPHSLAAPPMHHTPFLFFTTPYS